MIVYFKDMDDGFYQFDDSAPQDWYRHLIPITKVEYDAANVLSAQALSPSEAGMAHELHEFRELRAEVLNALTGIAGRATRAGDTTGIAAACDAASVSLTNITSTPSVIAAIAATDGASLHAAIMSEWVTIRESLKVASPAAAIAFKAAAM